MFTSKDLQLFDDEPRIKDITLGERAKLSRPRDIRRVIEANRTDLERYGVVRFVSAELITSHGARHEVQEYWLNEGQAIRLCSLLRTDTAEIITHGVITVFIEWRKSRTKKVEDDEHRLSSKKMHNRLMSVCKTRGFKKRGHYINLNQKINGSIFDVPTTEKVRQLFGFKSKCNLREELWKTGRLAELGLITTLMGLTTEHVEGTKTYGPKTIADKAYGMGREISAAIDQIRKRHLK